MTHDTLFEFRGPNGKAIAATLPPESITPPTSLPQVLELAEEARTALADATGYKVDSAVMYEAAAEDLAGVKAKQKRLAALKEHLLGPLREHVQRMRDFFAVPEQRLADAEKAIKTPMLAYHQKVESERMEAERKAREEAEAKRRAAEEAAAAQRKAAEAARIAAEQQLQAAATQAEREAAITAAERAQDAEQASSDALYAAQTAPLDIDRSTVPTKAKASGVSAREIWDAEVLSLRELVRAAATDDQLLAYLAADMTALRQAARAQKTHARIPGVRVFSKSTLASGAKPHGE